MKALPLRERRTRLGYLLNDRSEHILYGGHGLLWNPLLSDPGAFAPSLISVGSLVHVALEAAPY